MWKNLLVPNRPQMAIWRMRVARYLWLHTHTHTHTHTQYVIIIGFPLQQLLHKHASILRYSILPAVFTFTGWSISAWQ